MGEILEGGCACGHVRYRLATKPIIVHCCHCHECQRQTGSAYVLNAIIETDRLHVLSGKLEPTPVPTASGKPHDIYRCTKCLSAMWSDYAHRDYLRFVKVGTLDNPSLLPPDIHIYTASKVAWVTVPEGALAFPEYYKIANVWPPEAQARRLAAAGKA